MVTRIQNGAGGGSERKIEGGERNRRRIWAKTGEIPKKGKGKSSSSLLSLPILICSRKDSKPYFGSLSFFKSMPVPHIISQGGKPWAATVCSPTTSGIFLMEMWHKIGQCKHSLQSSQGSLCSGEPEWSSTKCAREQLKPNRKKKWFSTSRYSKMH